MNFLFHLYLSGNDPDILTGNFMGDFIKGRVGDDYPPGLKAGIVLHRKIDSFAGQHPLFRQSRERIAPDYGLWRGVLLDLFYDHFLSIDWDLWSTEPLDAYLIRAREMVEGRSAWLPERLRDLVPVVFDELIPSYREPAGIGRALERMARRVKRANPLAGGERELVRHYAGLRDDFNLLLPEMNAFAVDYLKNSAA